MKYTQIPCNVDTVYCGNFIYSQDGCITLSKIENPNTYKIAINENEDNIYYCGNIQYNYIEKEDLALYAIDDFTIVARIISKYDHTKEYYLYTFKIYEKTYLKLESVGNDIFCYEEINKYCEICLHKNKLVWFDQSIEKVTKQTALMKKLMNFLEVKHNVAKNLLYKITENWKDYLTWFNEKIISEQITANCEIKKIIDNVVYIKIIPRDNNSKKKIITGVTKNNVCLMITDPNYEDEQSIKINLCEEKKYYKEIDKDTYPFTMSTTLAEKLTHQTTYTYYISIEDIGAKIMLRRLNDNIDELLKLRTYSAIKLSSWLINIKNAKSFNALENKSIKQDFDKIKKLNEEQKTAILKILNTGRISFILGPPGTGKTTVITEAVKILIRHGQRVLISSQSNDAIDNVFDRLDNSLEVRCVRLSNKANTNEFGQTEIAWNMASGIEKQINKAKKERSEWINKHKNIKIEPLNTLHKIYNDTNSSQKQDKERIEKIFQEYDYDLIKNCFDFKGKNPFLNASTVFMWKRNTGTSPVLKQYYDYSDKIETLTKALEILNNILNRLKQYTFDKETDSKIFSYADENQSFRSKIYKLCNVFGITCTSDINSLADKVLNSESNKEIKFDGPGAAHSRL